jgi:hypothetical protein
MISPNVELLAFSSSRSLILEEKVAFNAEVLPD